MKLLITGGSGFIGSALVREALKNESVTVLNVDKLTYAANQDSLQEISNILRYSFKKLDICDAISLKAVFKEFQPTAVMHLAAESHVDRSIEKPSTFMQTNIIGTYNLPVTTYYFWPRTETWEQLRLELELKPWIREEEKIKVLNSAARLINFCMQEYRGTKSIEIIKKRFKEVKFSS